VIQFRGNFPDAPADLATSLVNNLPIMTDDLVKGAIATIRPSRVRIR